jgi:hypothetical protein
MAEGDGALQRVGGDMAGVLVPPDVVDGHLDLRKAVEDLAGQPPNRQLGGQVGHEHLHWSARQRR